MTQRVFWKYLTRLHRWAGLILGIQITLWFASGFFMSIFSIEKVRGTHLAQKHVWAVEVLPETSLIEAVKAYSGVPDRVELFSAVGTPVYHVEGDRGDAWINAVNGTDWDGVTASMIKESALKSYKGVGEISYIRRLEETPIEYRAVLPVWQVQFDDRSKTRLYFDAKTGELKSVRTRLWRAFDFMWMLHIMDYKARDNINLIWLKLFSGAALLFALSGLGLVVHRMWLRPKRPTTSRT